MTSVTITASRETPDLSRLAVIPKAIFRWSVRIIVAAAVVLFAAVALGPMTGKYQLLSVLTGSMNPTSPAGSLVFETPVAPSEIHVGDVITYQAPVGDRPVVTHRIIDIKTDDIGQVMINTKGDANPAADPWDAVLGEGQVWKVGFTVPFLGGLVQSMRTPFAHVLTMSLVPLILCFTLLRSIWRRPKKDEEVDLTERSSEVSNERSMDLV